MEHRMEPKKNAIAIDGPGGAGKSTVAKLLAQELGYIYVDTGAMYRSVALFCLNNGIDAGDSSGVVSALPAIDITIKHDETFSQRIFLNGEDVSHRIRLQDVADASSKVATLPEVREKLVDLQRRIANEQDVVMDGRDIGSFVLPNASLKVYMEADPSIRARRRIKELAEKGVTADFEKIREEIEERDSRDMNRKHSPLVKTDDAFVINTDKLSAEEVKDVIVRKMREEKLILCSTM